jgi:D-aspartate ligase
LKTSNKIRVLVLGIGPNGLGIVRALRHCNDLDVWAVNINGSDPGRFTRFAKILNWKYPENDLSEFQTRLYDLNANHEKTILFPTRDIEIYLLAELSTTLPENFLFYRNSLDTVKALADKNLVAEIAEQAGLNIPRTVLLSEHSSPQAVGVRYPILIKPLAQSASQTPFKNIFVDNEEAFQDVLKKYDNLYEHTVVQEFIPGGDDHIYHCTLLIDNQSRTIGVIEFQKIRQYLPMRGMTSYGHTILTRDMVRLSERLVSQVGYKGLANVEFKKNANNGSWVFIEANLRLPIFNSVFPVSGVNLACLYVTSLLQKVDNPVYANRTATWMHEENDLANILTRKVQTSFRVWLIQMLKSDSYAFWYIKDPLPGLYSFVWIVFISIRKVLTVIGLNSWWKKLCARAQRIFSRV